MEESQKKLFFGKQNVTIGRNETLDPIAWHNENNALEIYLKTSQIIIKNRKAEKETLFASDLIIKI